jgi:hypothetical protein
LGVVAAQGDAPALPPPRPLLAGAPRITLLTATGRGVERLDLDTGRLTTSTVSPREGRLPDARGSRALVPLEDGALLATDFGTWWVPRRGPVRPVGAPGDQVVAESRARAWLVRRTSEARVALVPVDGRTGVRGEPIGAFAPPDAAVSTGFVQVRPPTLERPAEIAVWEPATGVTRTASGGARLDGGVVDAAGDHVVYNVNCLSGGSDRCGLNSWNVVTGATRNHGRWSARTFTLAPDGTAAVFVPVSGPGAGSPQYLDLATGRTVPVPQANGFGRTVWGPDGWLFYSTDQVDGLAAWRPGMARPHILWGVQPVLSAAAAM